MLVWAGSRVRGPMISGRVTIPSRTRGNRSITSPSLLFRRRHSAVWTGSRMLVWGGLTCETATSVTDSERSTIRSRTSGRL